MKKALVLTLDMGTSSVRAMLFDARGRALPKMEAQIAYAQTTTGDGGVETDAEALLGLTVRCLAQLLKATDGETAGRIAGVGISCFWHSLVGVGADDRAVTPLLSWADTRARAQAEQLQKDLDEAAYHARTGCVLHTSYWPAKLRWLHETQAETFGRVRRWMSFAEYVTLRLFGETKCSLSMASGTGLFDPNAKAWDDATLKNLPIARGQLNTVADGNESQSGLTKEWGRSLAVLQDLPWFPAWGTGPAPTSAAARRTPTGSPSTWAHPARCG